MIQNMKDMILEQAALWTWMHFSSNKISLKPKQSTSIAGAEDRSLCILNKVK